MSLIVNLNQFKTLKCKVEKVARLEFRGVTKYSMLIHGNDEIITINQRFEWPVSTVVEAGEVLVLQLISRGKWSSSRVLGIYTLGLQILVADGQLYITDSLVDERNRAVPIFVDMEVFYIAPITREPVLSVSAINLLSEGDNNDVSINMDSACSSAHSETDDDNELENIEKNILSLERSIREKKPHWITDVESGDDLGGVRRFKQVGKQFLRRGFSMDANNDKISIISERPRKPFALKSMRSFIRRGKQRPQGSSDEHQILLEPVASAYAAAGVAGPSHVHPVSETSSFTSEEPLVDLGPREATLKRHPSRQIIDTSGPVALKAADFQVCITIIEARQLAGLNMDPVVCVQVGDIRKYTSVKESTNCPYYNEYFVFDFHMPPIMLFDKIITLSVLQSRNILRANKLLGNFKLDIATIWSQPDRQFYHKWALLTDPDDVSSGAKGYLKCDISVIGKGDPLKIPPKSEKDEDDIEANLLLPVGVPMERQRARFIITIYKADGLPEMNYSLLANVKRALTGESQDLVDPYVQVSFAGMVGMTTIKKSSYAPIWNEQITFTEMFPPLCQRIKIQLRDNDPVHPNIIGTHFIDLNSISSDGDKGFLPTFGPAYINLYGSTRDYSLLDQHANLNSGMGEGVSYRGRLLVSIHTEIMDIIEAPPSSINVGPTLPITENNFGKNEEFFLFGCIFDADMIDKRLTEKPVYFELSIGNAGNSLDGQYQSLKLAHDLEFPDLDVISPETGYWQSTTNPSKAMSNDKHYYYLQYWDNKPCMQIRSIWPDNRWRMYNSNLITNIIDNYEEKLNYAHAVVECKIGVENDAVFALKAALEILVSCCNNYCKHQSKLNPAFSTKLDKARQAMCLHEIEQIGFSARTLKALVTKNSLKDRLKTADNFLDKIKQLCEDPQHSLPDVFIWLISNNKRLAYLRIPARDLIFSKNAGETGKFCGKVQTLFLKWPGKKANSPSGWTVPAKINAYLWLGCLADKGHFIDQLPQGYEINTELGNAKKIRSNAPSVIYYAKKHNFQLRSHIYQARSLIGSDSSGLSDPFAKVIMGEHSSTTQVIDETLSPTWDEMLVIDEITIYGTMEYIKNNPPMIVVEIFDQDNVGKSEFIGRTLAKPHIKEYVNSKVKSSSLEWYEVTRGGEKAGELLAMFELFEIPPNSDLSHLPELPSPKQNDEQPLMDPNEGPILPVPVGIRPTLSKYRIEVLFWGLRDLKRVHLLTVDRPRVDIECAGHIIYSTVIQNAKRNPNFTSPVKYIDVELPDQDLYRPPLTIRVIDCRSFGRNTLVGTHTINSIHKYIFNPTSKRDREIEDRKKSLFQLQNIDLKTNTIVKENVLFTIENEKESCPLLNREGMSYGSDSNYAAPKRVTKRASGKRRKASSDSMVDSDEGNKDWWTKYFTSVEAMIDQEKQTKLEKSNFITQITLNDEVRREQDDNIFSPRSDNRAKNRQQAQIFPPVKTNEIPSTSLTKIYPHELEAVPEFDEFKEWLHSFDLYRGKKIGDDAEDENRVVGVFKGAIKVYKLPLPKGMDDCNFMGLDASNGFFQGAPSNEPIRVLVRVYIVKATDLHPMDLNGKADPYIAMQLGSKRISDKDSYVSKQLNPVFGKCFEFEATFPQDSMLTVQVLDWDLLGSDDLIGETKIDLENRFYSRHRATCGLPMKYEEQGYNRWRDSLKPTQILGKLCKEYKLDGPVYEFNRVKIGRNVFTLPIENSELFSNEDTKEEQMALLVLRRWNEIPRVGTNLVPDHVETRPLYNPNKPGVEQGRLEMWVDMFPMDMPLPGPQMDISPRKPKSYEMRVIIWNTDDVLLEDDAFFTGEKMSDIYVKGWLIGPDDCQSTDIHYRSLTGEGNFNWRFIYPFQYLEAEERIVITRKESVFSWDETECKIPARLELQVWDADHFSADDFLGAVTLDLNRFPRGAKSSNLCTLDMLKADGTVPTVNLFKQKRVKGWWPFCSMRENEEMELTGKVEAEIHLLPKDEADKLPVGLGRSEPDPLDKPNRPDASFMWFLNPLKSIRYIVWHNYKWNILKVLVIVMIASVFLLFFFAIPGYTVKRLLGA